MVNAEREDPVVGGYGPWGFAAASLNILVIEFATWVLLPWVFLAIILIPLVLADLAISAVLKSRPGKVGEVGRGMMIGCIAAPAAAVFFIPLYFLVQAADLI